MAAAASFNDEATVFEEVRAIELDERSRVEARHTAADAPALLDAATRLGYEACGLPNAWPEDRVHLNAHDPSIAAIDAPHAPDAILFGATTCPASPSRV